MFLLFLYFRFFNPHRFLQSLQKKSCNSQKCVCKFRHKKVIRNGCFKQGFLYRSKPLTPCAHNLLSNFVWPYCLSQVIWFLYGPPNNIADKSLWEWKALCLWSSKMHSIYTFQNQNYHLSKIMLEKYFKIISRGVLL